MMDDNVRKRFKAVIDQSGLDHKAASTQAKLGATYVRDVIVRKRGKLENILKIVDAIDPALTDWVRSGKGEMPKSQPAGLPVPPEYDLSAPAKGRQLYLLNGTVRELSSFHIVAEEKVVRQCVLGARRWQRLEKATDEKMALYVVQALLDATRQIIPLSKEESAHTSSEFSEK